MSAMFALEEAGFPIVIHVHDEIVCELKKGEKQLSEMIKLMTKTPAWSDGLPLSAEGWVGARYRKV